MIYKQYVSVISWTCRGKRPFGKLKFIRIKPKDGLFLFCPCGTLMFQKTKLGGGGALNLDQLGRIHLPLRVIWNWARNKSGLVLWCPQWVVGLVGSGFISDKAPGVFACSTISLYNCAGVHVTYHISWIAGVKWPKRETVVFCLVSYKVNFSCV